MNAVHAALRRLLVRLGLATADQLAETHRELERTKKRVEMDRARVDILDARLRNHLRLGHGERETAEERDGAAGREPL